MSNSNSTEANSAAVSETPERDTNRATAEPERPSAIERQRAATALFEMGRQAQREMDARDGNGRRLTLQATIAVLVLAAIGALLIVPEFRRAPLMALHATTGAVDDFIERRQPLPIEAIRQPASDATVVANDTMPAEATSAVANESAAKAIKQSTPAAAPAPTTNALSIPIESVKLHNRPELLAQVVTVYRAQLATNPNDAAALDALARLRAKALVELEVISGENNLPAAVTSLAVTSRLFPELADDARYQALVDRVAQMRPAPTESTPAVAAIPSTPTPTTRTPATAPTPTPAATNIEEPVAVTAKENTVEKPPVKSDVKPRAPVVAASTKTQAENPAQNVSEPAVAGKPEIQILSITPGRVSGAGFAPGEGGNVFMVVFNYRNIANGDSEPGAELGILLGNTGDRQVLGETSIDLHGYRGTLSVPLETLVAGYGGEAYKLNFILDGKLLASRTARLSAP